MTEKRKQDLQQEAEKLGMGVGSGGRFITIMTLKKNGGKISLLISLRDDVEITRFQDGIPKYQIDLDDAVPNEVVLATLAATIKTL